MESIKNAHALYRDNGPLSYVYLKSVIIHQTHYEKSDWSRVFNQFKIACELDMINAMSMLSASAFGFGR